MATYEVTTDGGTYEIETGENISQGESFARGAANNFPLAPQAIAGLSEGDYSQNLADWKQKAQEAKAANPKTYGAGAVTGAVAPAFIPGVGAALKAAPLAGNAVYGAASAISDIDLAQHPEEALKSGLKGAAFGLGTGAVLNKILPEAEGLAQAARNQGVKSAELRPGSLVDTEHYQDIGKFMERHNLVQGHLPERLSKTQELAQQYGRAIEDSGVGAAPLKDFTPFTDPLQAKAEQMSKMYDPQFKAQSNTYINGVKEIQQNGTDFAGLQRIKSAYGDRAFDADHKVVDQAAFDVWKSASDAMKSIIKDSPDQYQEAMTGYSHALDIQNGLSKQLGIERSVIQGSSGVGGHGLHSLLRQVPALHNPSVAIPGGVALGAMGHPVLGAALGVHSLMSNPQARSAALYGAAKVMPTVSAAARTGGTAAMVQHFLSNPQAYGKFAAPLSQAMQTGGKQGFAATSFVLRQQHPELNEIMLNNASSMGPQDITNEPE
jgi:hypothetical protein